MNMIGGEMLKFLLVDDERLALVQLEKMIDAAFQGQYSEIKSFQLVSEALDWAQEQQPDIVCLDINMPEMSGLEAAEKLQVICPGAEIIFVTAYDEFAIKAFEINAMDYLLKPISLQRLQKTTDRILARYQVDNEHQQSEYSVYEQKIHCFNKIKLSIGEHHIDNPKWRTAKAQELFAYLLHHRGEFVPKYKIINMFTPELEKKRAMTQLYTIIYQIRKYLKEIGYHISIDNDSIQEGYCLRLDHTWIDVEDWERRIQAIEPGSDTYFNDLELLLQQYEGDYMGDYDYLWAESERERLRQLWIQHAHLLLNHYYEQKILHKLITLGERLYTFSPYEFKFSIYLLEAYEQLGQFDKLKAYYSKLEKVMVEEFDLPLPEEIVNWYHTWIESRRSYT